MVEIARYFLAFTQHESCGKCTFCRIGTKRMLELLERLCGGQGKAADLDELERLAAQVKRGSLCGLGKSAPNPILTTLRYFREEVEAHIAGICPAGQCKALIAYEVTDACIGCTLCSQHCPANAIPPTPYERHVINTGKCVRCDACRRACPSNAIVITSGGRRVTCNVMPPTGLVPVEANVEVGPHPPHSTSFTTGTRSVGSFPKGSPEPIINISINGREERA
jgi:NADH-quinone oxidoreductase subunit F